MWPFTSKFKTRLAEFPRFEKALEQAIDATLKTFPRQQPWESKEGCESVSFYETQPRIKHHWNRISDERITLYENALRKGESLELQTVGGLLGDVSFDWTEVTENFDDFNHAQTSRSHPCEEAYRIEIVGG